MKRNDDSVFSSIQAVSGAPYTDASYNRDILKHYLLKKARQKGIRLPTGTQPDVYKYLGAFVETPTAGVNENVVYCDLACFTPDHSVVTPDGIRNITELEVGDPIYTLNEDTFEVERDVVSKTHKYQNKYGKVHELNGDTLNVSVTENHRFLTANKRRGEYGIKKNGNLQPDDYAWREQRELEEGRHVLPDANPMDTKSGEELIDLVELVDGDERIVLYYKEDERIPRWDRFPDQLAADVQTVYGTAESIGRNKKQGKHIIPIETFREYRNYLEEIYDEAYIVSSKETTSENGRVGNHLPLKVNKKSFLKLLAWFITEGNVDSNNPYRINIAQEDDQNIEDISSVIDNIGLHATVMDRGVSCCSGALARYLTDTCGDGSENKKVPELVYDSSKELKKIFLNVLIKGDGCEKVNVSYYWTKSEQLKDDISRLIVELGYTPRVWNGDVYRVGFGSSDFSFHNDDWESKQYDGNVYCVTGEKNSVILAGKNGNMNWVGNSLYPTNILLLNASPETIVGTRSDLQDSQYTEDDCVWGYVDTRPVKHIESGESWRQYTNGQYKMVYDPHGKSVKWTCDEADGPRYEKLYFLSHDTQKGFLTECVSDLIALKEKYRGTPLYAATKRIVNSVYGIVGFATQQNASAIYDWRLAEAITLTGRKIIQESRDRLISRLQQKGYDDVYACSGDTDATALSLPSGATKDQILRDVNEAVEWLNTEGYDEIASQLFGVSPEHRHIEIEVESFAPRLFIPSANPPHGDVGIKKRYIQHETWNDDDGDCDDISITGLEAERSDVAPITKDAQIAFAETVREDTSTAKEQLFPYLREQYAAIQDGSIGLSKICKRGGIGQNLFEYGTANRRPAPIYRGAKYANNHIDGITVQHGDKPAVVFIKKVTGEYPNTYSAETAEDGDVVDAVALPDPLKLPNGFVVDYEKHCEKVLLDPMKPLLDTRFGEDTWQEIIHQHEQRGIESFAD